MGEHVPRPPSYLSRKSLARELDVSESTVSDLVNRGILPKPISFTGGIVRWPWDDIVRALDSLKGGAPDETDPYLKAVKDAEKDKTE